MQEKAILEVFENFNAKCTSIGRLDNAKAAFLQQKCPGLFEHINSRTIIMWKDRIEHLKKHCFDTSGLSIDEMCTLIPEIIENPDYLGVRKKDSSIQFILLMGKLFEDRTGSYHAYSPL